MMRIILLFCCSFVVSGCVAFDHSVVAEKKPLDMEAVSGHWVTRSRDTITPFLDVGKDHGNGTYDVELAGRRGLARGFYIDNALILEVVPAVGDFKGKYCYARLAYFGDKAVWVSLDPAAIWLDGNIPPERLKAKMRKITGDNYVLEGEGADLTEMLKKMIAIPACAFLVLERDVKVLLKPIPELPKYQPTLEYWYLARSTLIWGANGIVSDRLSTLEKSGVISCSRKEASATLALIRQIPTDEVDLHVLASMTSVAAALKDIESGDVDGEKTLNEALVRAEKERAKFCSTNKVELPVLPRISVQMR
ncbi:MAG TPA: hypothetical protein VK968_10785 [Roseimicrobium sp.]|nr:hypothetical protein [Roseimicrobium sp.]